MSNVERFTNIFIGILTILAAILIVIFDRAYSLIIMVLGLYLTISGLRYLIYYIRMARHMVGGKIMLVIGAVIFSFGMFTLNLSDEPLVLLVLYLLGFHAFAGLVNVLRALEAKRYDAPSWKLTFTTGMINILVALAVPVWGILFKTSTAPVVIFCLGLVYSGVVRIISAFRETEIVYIQ